MGGPSYRNFTKARQKFAPKSERQPVGETKMRGKACKLHDLGQNRKCKQAIDPSDLCPEFKPGRSKGGAAAASSAAVEETNHFKDTRDMTQTTMSGGALIVPPRATAGASAASSAAATGGGTAAAAAAAPPAGKSEADRTAAAKTTALLMAAGKSSTGKAAASSRASAGGASASSGASASGATASGSVVAPGRRVDVWYDADETDEVLHAGDKGRRAQVRSLCVAQPRPCSRVSAAGPPRAPATRGGHAVPWGRKPAQLGTELFDELGEILPISAGRLRFSWASSRPC